MANPIKRAAMGAVEVAAFGAGLAEGAVKAVARRVGRQRSRASAEVPVQREKERPTVPTRPTPDPYDVGVTTPVGTTGAGPAYNPSTAEADLQQPGTEEIMEPSTTKRIKSEADMMRKAAERNPE
jgi:hypothetical protein